MDGLRGCQSRIFLSLFMSRVIEVAHQEWHTNIQEDKTLYHYRNFKSLLEPEKYITDLPDKYLISAIARIRCSCDSQLAKILH